MFQLSRRTSVALVVAASTIGSGLAVSPASASPAAPPATIAAAPQEIQPIALLIPAVQSAREAARAR